MARNHLRGADLAVYEAAQQLTSGGQRILRASRKRLASMTAYTSRTMLDSRARLVRAGWWKPVNQNWRDDQRTTGKAGKFLPPEFIVVQHEAWAAEHPNQCQSDDSPTVYSPTVHGATEHAPTEHGKTADTVHGPTTSTVHGRTVHKSSNAVSNYNSKESKEVAADAALLPDRPEGSEPAGEDFGNPKTAKDKKSAKTADPRVRELADCYRTEYKKLHRIKARLEPGDFGALALMLKSREEDAATLIGWLRNAFQSEQCYANPLRSPFQLRTWVAKAESFAAGPIKKSASRGAGEREYPRQVADAGAIV
jgi:hypothetical protein